jgi:hypothetical protein
MLLLLHSSRLLAQLPLVNLTASPPDSPATNYAVGDTVTISITTAVPPAAAGSTASPASSGSAACPDSLS